MAIPGILRRWLPFALAAGTLAVISPPSGAADRDAGAYRFSGPYAHGNLTIFMVHGKPGLAGSTPITLQEAMQRGAVRVIETGSVNELQVENLGAEAAFIQSGDIVKGGKQDRVLSVDLVLPPRSGKVAIASFCVEQNRWTRRGQEDVGTFASSAALLPSRDMKLAARAPLIAGPQASPPGDGRRPPTRTDAAGVGTSQGKVWRGVADMQDKLQRSVGAPVAAPQSASSLQLSMESERLKQATAAYVAALSGAIDREPEAIGFVFAINGRINSADIYGAPVLFRKLWPKLLQASVVEALAERREGPAADAPAVEAVQAFLAEAESGNRTSRRLIGTTTLEIHDSQRVQLLEARVDGKGVVHRSYVSK
jgi:hypothetical protein